MVENDSSMLLQVFLHVNQQGDPLVEEVTMSGGKLYCTCDVRDVCSHLAQVVANLPHYLSMNDEHTPEQRRDHVIRNTKTLVLR
jgi:hypothetical protein